VDLRYIKKLVRLLENSNVDEMEVEEEGKKIRLVKRSNNSVFVQQAGQLPVQMTYPPGTSPPTPVQPLPPQVPPVPAPVNHHEITSPIVGTFYRAPAPDAAPFVDVGTLIQPGTVLCIVEAMKLMNEIESDLAGKIVKIMVENGQPVEYGQTLFLVEKA
jgi:acetyl-CoA carboxylase biotin carboxyl carrier protein